MDRFLRTEIEARALSFVLANGWIDALAAAPQPAEQLIRRAGVAPYGAPLLFGLLRTAEIVEIRDDAVRLTDRFRAALTYRDLLEAKLWFAELVASDVHQLFVPLLTDVPQFMARAKVFELFRYDRALEVTEANLAATGKWVGYTTALTRYEAPAFVERLELSYRRTMLDIGGNSGEFARQLVRRWPQLQATIFDLPVVCALGERHLGGSAEAGRVKFRPGDLRRDALPGGQDLVTFKSVLHDWPDGEARLFLRKAVEALAPGGLLAIFERTQIETGDEPMPYSMVANLVFLPFFRDRQIYLGWLAELGLEAIETASIALEMPFHLIVARKSA